MRDLVLTLVLALKLRHMAHIICGTNLAKSSRTAQTVKCSSESHGCGICAAACMRQGGRGRPQLCVGGVHVRLGINAAVEVRTSAMTAADEVRDQRYECSSGSQDQRYECSS